MPRVDQQHRRRRRWLMTVLVAVGAFGAGWVLAPGAPVGHFRTAEGMEAYLEAYDRAMAEMPVPQQTLDVPTSYGVVRVYRFAGRGDGAPLVLLPGGMSGTPMWADNMAGLLAHRSVYTVDLLGQPGRSVQSRPISDAEDQAAWLTEVFEQFPEERVNLVGLSFGGWMAANLALHDSRHLTTLTLIEPMYVVADMSVEAIVRSIPASVPWLPKSWRDSFASWTAGGAAVQDVPVAEMIEAGMQGYSIRTPTPRRISEDRLRGLDVPALVILAGDSPMHDAQAGAETARSALPDASVGVYEGASHAINGEHPDRLAADIGAFVDARGAA